MTYFARKGDAKMCRYLISRGASTTKCSEGDDPKMDYEDGLFPMHEAADEGHFDICKVLYENGASYHIWKEHPLCAWAPIHAAANKGHDEVVRWLVLQGALCAEDGPIHAAANKGHDEVVRWLVLQGALCAEDISEEIDEDCIYPKDHVSVSACKRMASSYKRLVEWAKMVVQTHSAVVTFLGGTLPPVPDTVQNGILQCLSGHPGVRKHIGDFVGLEVTKKKQLRILQSVADVMPSYFEIGDDEEDLMSGGKRCSW
eukprot:CAMPEP_0185827278 /NCGR_PEP_ID=MMETSP1322-20130828/31970_1 /TAXON_ID=265543 /ORGANISM="Minutocellus polymorphus, Strain RCC2270" /LENGTH=256 /DNA_ID=CAMNT_0028525009 /DNA_START=12 /DNA_END=780 /DNA_ORIENTATION=-